MYYTDMFQWREEKSAYVYLLCMVLSISMLVGMYYSETKAEQHPYFEQYNTSGQSFSVSRPVLEDAIRLDNEIIRSVRPVIQSAMQRGIRSITRAELIFFVLLLLCAFYNRYGSGSFSEELANKRSSYFILQYIHDQDGLK